MHGYQLVFEKQGPCLQLVSDMNYLRCEQPVFIELCSCPKYPILRSPASEISRFITWFLSEGGQPG